VLCGADKAVSYVAAGLVRYYIDIDTILRRFIRHLNWQVVESGVSPQHAAVRAALRRGLLAALDDSRQLSHHPAAAGAAFRLLLLGLQASW